MPRSYYEQFRINQRNKYRNGLSSTSKAVVAERAPPLRPTAVRKQPSRSDTFTLPTKRNGINVIALSVDPEQNRSPRQAAREPVVKNSSPFTASKPTRAMQSNSETRPAARQPQTVVQLSDPVRFSKQQQTRSSSPLYSRKTAPVVEPPPASDTDRSRRIWVGNDEYVLHSETHSTLRPYYETRSTSPTDKPRSQRIVHIVREPPLRETGDLYDVEPEQKQAVYEQPRNRTGVIQKTVPPPDYLYVDEIPTTMHSDRQRYPHRSRVVYIGNDRPLNYAEETIYVDDHGNEIQYIYEAEPIYRRRPDIKTHYYSPSDTAYE